MGQQSDIAAELDQAEVETDNSFSKIHQRSGKEVIMQGEPSHLMVAPTPSSSSRVECEEVVTSKESLCEELEWKKLDIAKFLIGFTAVVPLPNKLVCVEIPRAAKVSLEEEDPEKEDDPKEEEHPEENDDLEEFPTEV
ncbi:hypothetical protein FNV43_RR04269 [Rhamnella rubrinervis]|uniref:Uncharacterized protein n=1 Tax=Rhamnella rubrinervis TaxID=2594499 RepID=A0A8K0HKQ0_9ROSA|nr:hypothetical protein FNV43_RR04269 [Rhamnella rubrinervis]